MVSFLLPATNIEPTLTDGKRGHEEAGALLRRAALRYRLGRRQRRPNALIRIYRRPDVHVFVVAARLVQQHTVGSQQRGGGARVTMVVRVHLRVRVRVSVRVRFRVRVRFTVGVGVRVRVRVRFRVRVRLG